MIHYYTLELLIMPRAVCRNFAKLGGGVNLGYLKKRGAQLQAASGGALEDNVKKLVW